VRVFGLRRREATVGAGRRRLCADPRGEDAGLAVGSAMVGRDHTSAYPFTRPNLTVGSTSNGYRWIRGIAFA
jgi:hypothetical protein